MKLFRRDVRGITVIEVVSVLILLSVLSAVVYSRVVNTGVDLFQAAEGLKSHLRYAQTRAMNSDPNWGILFAADSYTLMCLGDECPVAPDPPPNLPLMDSPNLSYPGGVSMPSLPETNPLYFNRLGAPIDGSGALVGNDVELSLTDGVSSRLVTVVRNTGFVQ